MQLIRICFPLNKMVHSLKLYLYFLWLIVYVIYCLYFSEGRIQRQISSDSMSSINSMSSACSFTSQQSAATDGDLSKKKKKKGWVRRQEIVYQHCREQIY